MGLNHWNLLNRDITACASCPRLVAHCHEIATTKRKAFRDCNYWGRSVPNFGDPQAKLLIVGLAPGAHGANRTGRMFTGDRSGEWLYRALFRAGFSNQADSTSCEDGLELRDCAITAICHCAPPGNKPSRTEISQCEPWLRKTIDLVDPQLVLALGQIAWKGALDECLKRGWYEGRRPKFAHGVQARLTNGRWLIGSYHPSQQNTFTGKLTESMFDDIFNRANRLLRRADSTRSAGSSLTSHGGELQWPSYC